MPYDDDDDVLAPGVAEIERRADIERTRARGARVEVELTEDTPFRHYVDTCRTDAIQALARLSEVDPTDAIAVLREQHIVRAYLRVREWSRGEIEASINADQMLRDDSSGD